MNPDFSKVTPSDLKIATIRLTEDQCYGLREVIHKLEHDTQGLVMVATIETEEAPDHAVERFLNVHLMPVSVLEKFTQYVARIAELSSPQSEP
jgi:hypothetical protein